MKLVFLDVDGTLINGEQQMPDSARSALEQAAANGHTLFLCTGRSLPEIYPWLLHRGMSGILAANGTYAEIDGKVLFEHLIAHDTLLAINQYLQEVALAWAWQNNDGTYPQGQFELAFQPGAPDAIGRIKGEWEDYMKQMAPYWREGLPYETPKGMFIIEKSKGIKVGDVQERFAGKAAIFEGPIQAHGCLSGEVVPYGINKGTGLADVVKALGKDISETVAVGDGWNDIEMLEVAGLGIAMGNALPEVADYADWQTTDVNDDGLANAFKYAGLI